MFKFTTRELLLLTVIVALVVGWTLREHQFRQQLADGRRWHAEAEDLARFLKDAEGWKVDWNDGSVYAKFRKGDPNRWHHYIFSHSAYNRAAQEYAKLHPSQVPGDGPASITLPDEGD